MITKAWKFRSTLKVDHTKVTANQTDFPVAVVWNGAAGGIPSAPLITGGAKAAKSDGSDIRFTTDIQGLNEVPFEIVQWTQNAVAADARAEMHVKLSPSSSSDTLFYMWWGNAAASAYAVGATFGRNNVWTNNFIWVSHCSESAGATMIDSTGGQDGVYSAAMPTRVDDGPMRSSQAFTNAANKSAYINSYAALGFAGSANMTLTVILKLTTLTVFQSVFAKTDGTPPGTVGNLRWQWYGSAQPFSGSEDALWRGFLGGNYITGAGSTGVYSNAAYRHGSFVYDHTNGFNYVNGTKDTALTQGGDPYDDATDSLIIGNWNSVFPGPGSDQLRSSVDELRIARTNRSDSWESTENNALTAPETFVIAGTADTVPQADFSPFFAAQSNRGNQLVWGVA